MAENKHIMTAEAFVEQVCAKIREFEESLYGAFQRTVEAFNADRAYITAANTEILALKARVDVLERLVGGLPPRTDA